MPVKYSVVARKNPLDPEAPPKYYAQSRSSGKTTIRQIGRRIAEISTVSLVDAIAAVEAFLQVVPQEIADGNIVRLGEFGSFSLIVKSEGSENETDVSSNNIIKNKVAFRPGKEFKQALDNITYEKG